MAPGKVKRVLGRMEALKGDLFCRSWQVCLEDLSVMAQLKGSLRARLAEALLFSEEAEGKRSLRVGVLSLSMAPHEPAEVAAGLDLPGAVP